MLTKKKISIVPVAYLDEGNIEELYKRITKVMKENAPNYEIVYVNDGSPDRSQEILEKLAKRDHKLTVITHSRNFGNQNAFTTGMKQSIGDAVVILDGDVQDPPEVIPEFIKKWLEGYDVVYGVRERREDSFGKFAEWLYHQFYIVFNKISYMKIPEDTGEFSLMDRKVVDQINSLPETDRFIRLLRTWIGFKQTGVGFVRLERFSGQGVALSNWSRKLDWIRRAIINFSYATLDWVFNMAAVTVFVSLLAIIVNLILYFIIPGTPRGFLTILIAVLFFGSVQLISISVICEYLRKIFEEVKRRPNAIPAKIINNHR